MKKIIVILILIYSIIPIRAESTFSARSYIVMNQDTLQVLESKNMDGQYSVASISKIMTAIVAIENGHLTDLVTPDESILKAYGSAVYIQVGEKITLQDLIYGLLLRSGNDAAIAIADYLGDNDVSKFVGLMNEKAKQIGMKNTIFNNPSGLDQDDAGNLSTAYDMALLMSYCMKNETFQKITSTKRYERLDKKGIWSNKNRLINSYEYTTGGKTGFTEKAKRTLVSSATKNHINLVVVTLNAGNDFEFHEYLYEKYFEMYDSIKILDQGINEIMGYQFEAISNVYYPKLKNSNEYKVLYELDKDNQFVRIIMQDHKENRELAYYPITKVEKMTWIITTLNSFLKMFS